MRSCCENEQHSLNGIEKYAFIHRIEKQFDLHRNACILFNNNNLYANQCWYHMEDTRCLCIQLISSEWATVRTNIYTLMHICTHTHVTFWNIRMAIIWISELLAIVSLVYTCTSIFPPFAPHVCACLCILLLILPMTEKKQSILAKTMSKTYE